MATRVTDLRNASAGYAALDDRMLVLDFQAGNPEAFVEIHHRYSGLARHVCSRFLPNANDADEALQETMIRVYQGLHRFNGRYALQPWIARIATNVSLDAIRTRARRPQLHDDSIDELEREDPAAGPEEAVERLIERDLVLSVLAGLSDTHRTALVLRELEGRSHQQIAEAMEISPSQAKALIHRAKVSFRRRWLEKVSEKGGLAGIAVMPLVWFLQRWQVGRRVADRVAHASSIAQVATPEIVSTASSSPVVVATGAGLGERVVAASVTLLVAGSVTVGAATIARDRGDGVDRAERSAKVVVVPAPPVEAAEEPVPAPLEPVVRKNKIERVKPKTKPEPVVVEPAPDPTTAPSPTPEATPSPAPDPQPSPPPSPEPIPPTPAWGFDFRSSVGLGTGAFQLISSRVVGGPDEELIFAQTVAAPRFDADGVEVGRVYVEYWGAAEGPFGSVDLWLFVDTPQGRFRFDGTGQLAAATSTSDGDATYVFSGSYVLVESPPAPEDPAAADFLALHDGSFELQLGLWRDGESLYTGALSLSEA